MEISKKSTNTADRFIGITNLEKNFRITWLYISNDVPHVLTGTLPPRYRTKVQCTKSWLRTNAWIDDGNGHEVCEEIHNWSSYGFHIEELQKRWNKVSLFRRLSSISNDLLDDEPPTILTTRAALKKDLKKHHKMIKSSALSNPNVSCHSAFEEAMLL